MQYTQDQIDEARSKDIREVAEDLNITLYKRGSNFFCRCISPQHDDRRPSMMVGGRMNIMKCMSCDAVYDVFSLLRQEKGMGFREAMEYLAPHQLPPRGEGKKKHPSPNIHHPTPITPTLYTLRIEGSGAQVELSPDYKGEMKELMPSMEGSLSQCLLRWFGYEEVERVTMRYMLGQWTSPMCFRGTMFPLIDMEGRCRNIKVQQYGMVRENADFCHRKGSTVWLGTVLQEMGKYKQGVRFATDVLFGEHLLRLPGTVGLVEAPKTAVVCALRWPELIWVAAGNKTALTERMLSPLRGRDVIVFADKDAHEEWSAKIASMRHIANFVMSTWWMDEVDEKGDVADWVLGFLGVR